MHRRFRLETKVLRELYAYCWSVTLCAIATSFADISCSARVAYTKVEQQLKSRGIPYTHVNPSLGGSLMAALSHIHSSLARAIPALCVQSSDILSGAPAAEAAMPNIRVIPLNWWTDQKVQVHLIAQLLCAAAYVFLAGGHMCEAEVCTAASWQTGRQWCSHSSIEEDHIRHKRSCGDISF